MPRGLCKVILIGNAGDDGIVRYTPNGTPVLRISLATSTGGRGKGQGQKPSEADWHQVIIVGPQAEDRENSVTKGCQCYVEGTLRSQKAERGSAFHTTVVYVGREGTFRVYHAPSPGDRLHTPVRELHSSPRPLMRDRPIPDRGHPTKISKPHIGNLGLAPADDDWLSFDGLTLNDYSEPDE